jgi:UDP-2-acetamido-2-deoxy-ribo-hexuluronate aminotransferase
MKDIKMVDLHSQYLKIKKEIDEAISGVIESTAFIKGPEVKRFQEELEKYLNVSYVIPCANGTDALQLALMSLNLKPGDEIITSTFTFIATVEVIALLGLKPVLVDIDPDTFNLSVADTERAINSKTKAIMPVHLFGQAADMDELESLAKKNDLKIIEDAAQAVGADYNLNDGSTKKCGTVGDIGCASFFPSKNLGCYGDGGAVMTNDSVLAEKIASIANHGMKKRYYYDDIGINSRLDSIQAAILRVKLKYLDQYNKARIEAADNYDKLLETINMVKTPYRKSGRKHIFHQYTIILDENINRDGLQAFLKENNIPAMIYYPVPLHLQNAYKFMGYQTGDMPVAEKLSKQVLSLPMHTELDRDQQEYIVSKIRAYCQ